MKKTYALLALGAVLVALCVVLVVTLGPKSPAGPTEEPADAPAELEKELEDLFGKLGSWYNMALGSEYDQPEYVNLRNLFYNGFKDESYTPTDAEWAELKDQPGFEESTWELIRLPVSKINVVLKQYFGITLEDIKNPEFDGFVYLESTDCYYTMHTDAECLDNFQVIAAEEQHDGTIRMTYTANDGDAIYMAVIKPVDGGYQILSNQKNIK